MAKPATVANRDKTHCPQGHPLVPGNLRGGKRKDRSCLTCHRERERARQRAKGAKPRVPLWERTVCAQGHDLSDPKNRRSDGRCAECHRQNERRWRLANPEEAARRQKVYAARSRERINARYRVWRAYRRPDDVRRRTRPVDIDYALILASDPCSYCGAVALELDHIVPITGGGTATWENLTSACRSCNARKWAKPLTIFLLERSKTA